MKLLIFGSEKEKIPQLVKKFGFKLVIKSPDVVVSYGGDGTLMKSEYQFPGVPKLILRASSCWR